MPQILVLPSVMIQGNSLEEKLRQFWSGIVPPEKVFLAHSKEVFYIVAQDVNQEILGALSLTLVHTKRIDYGVIHDVLVSEKARGKGLGARLMESALRIGEDESLSYIELTCKPSREGANHLYTKLGFQLLAKATEGLEGRNYYRYIF